MYRKLKKENREQIIYDHRIGSSLLLQARVGVLRTKLNRGKYQSLDSAASLAGRGIPFQSPWAYCERWVGGQN